MIRFDSTPKDAELISKIADRAVTAAAEAGWHYAMSDAEMDLTACHLNGNPLDLAALAEADDFNFSHDVFGIRKHLNRKTGKLMDFFTPRYTKKTKKQERELDREAEYWCGPSRKVTP